jgi:SOS-response transcriptional repressor LexA
MMTSASSAAAILRRIDLRLKTLGITDSAASLKATGSRDTIRSIRRNVAAGVQRGISTETVRKLAAVLQTTEQWLLSEIGPASVEQPLIGQAIRMVPLLSWVSAGRMLDADVQIPMDDVPLLGFSDLGRGDFFALRVQGDSMDRVSPEGSIIVVNRAERTLINGRCYVFSVHGQTTYKRWHAEPPYLAPYSTNPAHEPIFLKRRGEAEVIGRVRRSMLDL